MTAPRFLPEFFSTGGRRFERVAGGVFMVLTAWCFLVVPSDLNGDPNDYLFIARSMLNDGFGAQGLTAMRTPGYPLFITVTSLGLRWINGVFLAQAVIFVVAVWWFARTYARSAAGRGTLYLVAALPFIGYLRKLLFPDGVLLSLGLVAMSAMTRRRWGLAVCAGLALMAIKVIFGFTLAIVAGCWLRQRLGSARWRTGVWVLLAGGGPLVLIAGALGAFPNVFYLTMLWRPGWNGVEIAQILPAHVETWRSGSGREIVIDYAAVRRHAASLEHVVVWASPLTPATEDTAPAADLLAAKRRILRVMLEHNTAVHVRLAALYYWRSFFGAPLHSHVDYMLAQKALRARQVELTAYHAPSELAVLADEDRLGPGYAVQLRPPALAIYTIHQATVGLLWMGPFLLLLPAAFIWRTIARRRAARLGRDFPAGIAPGPILLFLHLNAAAMAVAAQALADRYALLPFVLCAGLVVLVVESIMLRPTDGTERRAGDEERT